MQGGFIGGFKENLKAIKQEIRGAEIFDEPIKFNKSKINQKEFRIWSSIYAKEFIINTLIYKKKFSIEVSINTLNKTSFHGEVANIELQMETKANNLVLPKSSTVVFNKDFGEFRTVALAKPIELTKKSKIKKEPIDKFKVKTFEGTDKIRKIGATVEGRRFLTNKELIDLAIKVKSIKRDLDFTKYNFKAVFERLPYDLIEDYQYLDDSVELKIFYKKYTREAPILKNLVILVEKNSLTTEKIFI